MTKRTYDIRLRNAIARTGDPDLFPDLNIPRSTALQWIREGVKEVVTHPSLGKSCDALTEENAALQKKCSAEKAKNEPVNILRGATWFQMQYMRVAAGELKAKLLVAIDTTKALLSLKGCLESIGVRIHPPKPKTGIRALEPNQICHVDVSVFRIMNGAKVYTQAIIDNASRYVLAWEVTQTYGGANTKHLSRRRLKWRPGSPGT
jgi:hypothetical protein